ncbi:MAG TPA: hypothetical protein VFZ34_09975 [Blastocatellia bacterium]|nr:hypothetical protein [Blastocatellia bacterium]
MDSKYAIANITEALERRAHPTITLWNRLEGRPRTADFKRALKAEVRDALWMLTKQWQMGEFRGDDAGSPVFAKIHTTSTPLDKYRPDVHAPEAFDDTLPLETKVECRPLNFGNSSQKLALDVRLLMGRQWLKLVRKVGNYQAEYIAKYPIQMPDPERPEDAHLCAHQEIWQSFAAASGRMMDGASLYFYLKAGPTRHAYDGIAVDPTHQNDIDELATKFITWFEKLFYQPQQNDAWEPARLEYRFAVATPTATGEKVYDAEEYYHGHLDWYNFDIDKQAKGLGEVPGMNAPVPPTEDTQSLLPTPIVYEGMPNTRWWTFEDRKTNFGDIKPETTDLAKLLLMEFGLVYANDWFLIPHVAAAGSIITVAGLAVTNVFGERFWIEPAGSGADDNWQRWSMFTVSVKGKAQDKADMSLLLLPTVPKIQESAPLEEAMLIRDEVANMVWGIEKTIPAPTGQGKRGSEAATETLNFYRRLLAEKLGEMPPVAPIEYKANIRYEVMNTVPEHWIPFIPVHVPDDIRAIQLQRAAMPRVLEGDPDKPRKVRPRTALLREGLDTIPAAAYFLHEEEVPRAGVRVTQSFQRTRWRDGAVFVWLGARKQTGRGEGASGLAFDQIPAVKK